MPQTIQPAYQTGQLVNQTSMQAVQDAARNLVGSSIAAILGINSANGMDSPFTVTASGGMTVTAGGTGGQKILLNSASGPRLVDAIPTQVFTVPAADVTNARNDIIYGSYAQTQVLSSSSGQIATLAGTTITVSPGNIYNSTEAMTYTYVAGTPSGTPVDPSGPAGSVKLARIVVAANASSITTGNITLLLVSAQSQILSGVAGYVDLTSNQTIAGNKAFSGVTTAGGIQVAYGDTPYSGVAGIRQGTNHSIYISPTTPGNYLALGYDCLTLSSVNFGPLNAWSYVNSNGFCSLATDGHSAAGWVSNNGSNQTVIGCNSGSGYSGFSVALLAPGGGNGGTFVRWLLGISASGSAFIPNGPLVVQGVRIPTSFSSSDSSVSVTNSGGTLNLTLPAGYCNSFYSGDGSLSITPSGRSINIMSNAPKVYNQSGGIISGVKIVTGQSFIGSSNTQVAINLSGSSVFSSSSSYQVTANTIYSAGSSYMYVQVNIYSGSQFTLNVDGPSGSCTVSWIAIGY